MRSKEEKKAKVTRNNGKYKRISEVEEITGISREVLLYRLKIYEDKTNDIVLIKDQGIVLIDWDKVCKAIPTLIESELQQDLIKKIVKLEEDMNIFKEICYSRGYLRRENK